MPACGTSCSGTRQSRTRRRRSPRTRGSRRRARSRRARARFRPARAQRAGRGAGAHVPPAAPGRRWGVRPDPDRVPARAGAPVARGLPADPRVGPRGRHDRRASRDDPGGVDVRRRVSEPGGAHDVRPDRSEHHGGRPRRVREEPSRLRAGRDVLRQQGAVFGRGENGRACSPSSTRSGSRSRTIRATTWRSAR